MRKAFIVLGFCAALGGCSQPMKPTVGGHLGDPPPAPVGTIPPPVQALPVPPKPKPSVKAETYSVVVNNVNVRELLFALARDAKVNVDIHPGISGAVTLNAIDQTLPQLLSRISKQVDMRYELDGPNLVVMPDSPYLRVYKIDYVNIDRQTTGQVSVSSEIIGQQPGGTGGAGGAGAGAGAGAGGGAGGGQNASRVTVRNTSQNQFWTTLVDNIKDILRETDKVLPTSAAQSAPGPMAGVVPAQPGGAQGAGAAGAPGGAAAGPNVSFREAASVIPNAEASVLTIRATSRQHEKIQEFLDQVLVNAKRQVLIEATIVEVTLNNSYQQGIDWAIFTGGWQLFGGGLFRGAAQALAPIPAAGALTALPTANAFVGQYNSNTFKFSLQLLETFGNVRVLSSPRISAISNQTAVLKVVENIVYFTIQAQTTQAQTTALTTFTTTPNVVPVGIILSLTPQISDTDTVLLSVKPTISTIKDYVNDPNPALAQSNPPIVSRIPQIVTREMESVIKLSSGQIAVMGGLIQDQLADKSDTIPGVNRVPFLGDFLSNKNIQNSKVELVIFMRPIVIRDPSIDGDYRGYRVFLPGEDFMSQPNPGKPRLCDPPNIEGCPK
jgi:general secretion pathway protein D